MKSSDNQYWIALDHIRALAALTVFVWHFLHSSKGYPVPFEGAPLIPPFALFDEGHAGVAIFMTLSGYLFAKLLSGKEIIYFSFFFNRALRLFPLLFFVFILHFIEMKIIGQGDSSGYLTRILGGFVFPVWPNGGWSITTELHFYILLPLLLYLSRHNNLWLLIVLLSSILMRVGIYTIEGSVQELAYFTIVGRIDQFIIGILLFIKRDWILSKTSYVIAIFITFYIIYWFFNNAGGFYTLGDEYPSKNPIWIILPTLEGLAFGTLIAFYDRSMKSSSNIFSKIWADYGKFSYSIYLLHFFIVFRVANFINTQIIGIDNFYLATFFAILTFLAMYPLGWISYKFIEEPFLRYRKRYIISPLNTESTNR